MLFKKKEKVEDIDKGKVNEVLSLSKKLLKLLYLLFIVLGIFTITILFKEWKIMNFVLMVLKIIAPLFIGLIIAWLFDPFVKYLKKKGIRRLFGTIIAYFLIIALFVVMISSIVPLLTDQINDFAKMIPGVLDSTKDIISKLLNTFSNIDGFNVEKIKLDIFANIENYGLELSRNLPTLALGFLKSFFEIAGSLLLGMIIGFYLLISFDNANELTTTLVPKKFRKDASDLTTLINTSLRSFVQGALINSLLVFIVSSLVFALVGLKAPLLFGLFCGITNIIPYAGPYIGGAPAVLVGFSQGPVVGIATLIAVTVIQLLEGNFIQPVVMSKTTHLHPVTIMIGLLIFGHFFGIIGMVVSTPLIASVKAVVMFFDDKYDILKINN